ncbi:unnamed protein product [Spodoptera littoralis]|uniref:Pre-mRNA cleavage complex 2 protein Pcf11 n=1 Tax=Spodoptera littoralis TaxID=7109 RepID=A0A9P0HTB2_SPOLI|nr:unnamed protein product [Spodoptera littoralis]CAH1634941.1 unnamed protein product [Spodoptera littoralis]
MATPTPAPAAANQRLGPPVPKSIAPVSAWQRRDPRLARLQQAVVAPTNVFETRRRDARRTRQQLKRRSEELLQAESERNHADTKPEAERNTMAAYVDKLPDPKTIENLPSIPKITRPEVKRDGEAAPAKRKRKNVCTELPPAAEKKRASSPELVAFKGLRNDHKEHHMHRNRDKSASPEHVESGAEGAVTSEPPNTERERRRLSSEDTDLREDDEQVPSPKTSPNKRNRFGDIDESITPSVYLDTPPDSQGMLGQDSDMRLGAEALDMKTKGLLPILPMMPMCSPYQQHMPWRGTRPRAGEEFGPRRFRGPMPPYFRAGKFDKRAVRAPFMPFSPRMAIPLLATPKIGMYQGECPLTPYKRSESPPPLGTPDFAIPPTDFKVINYIDQDPFKIIQIDGIPREIRFYGNTAVIMLDWDDPREIKFLPGCRRVIFDSKHSVVLTFSEGYKQVEFDDQVFNIKFGAPTRELYINGRWHECFFGGQPFGVIIDGKPRLVHLEGPMPQVDIGKAKRTDLVAGKINLIVNATQMHPVYLDAKVQKILVNGQYLTVRFVDSLRTVLINEQPFKAEFGGLPKPIVVGSEKYSIRFSALPRNIKPGHVQIANMEGIGLPLLSPVKKDGELKKVENPIKVYQQEQPIARLLETPSSELNLDMLVSVMPSSTVPVSSSEYSVAEHLFSKTDKFSGLEKSMEENLAPVLPILGNMNGNDLFNNLVATGIVQVPSTTQPDPQEEAKNKPEEVKNTPREDKNIIQKVDFMKSDTLRVKQPGLVATSYGGKQCLVCAVRFPSEHTVHYWQHLDWHLQQNRRHKDAARRDHSRHCHYDRSNCTKCEEVEDLEEREESWFETGGNPAASGEAAVEAPSVAASESTLHCCALCGDIFQQFFNNDEQEWHIRNAIKHKDDYYHPLCFKDYKTALTKAGEPKVKESSEDIASEETMEEESIETKDVDRTAEQSDDDSVDEDVEDPRELDPVDDEDNEADGCFKAEQLVELLDEDDPETGVEISAERAAQGHLAEAEIDVSEIKFKREPIDPGIEKPIGTADEETIPSRIYHTHPTVESSIDGDL